jgi:hypothetical protein
MHHRIKTAVGIIDVAEVDIAMEEEEVVVVVGESVDEVRGVISDYGQQLTWRNRGRR